MHCSPDEALQRIPSSRKWAELEAYYLLEHIEQEERESKIKRENLVNSMLGNSSQKARF